MAREAGDICNDPSPTPGFGTCFCGLSPNHPGNFHWCVGDGTHRAHGWPIIGKEIPVATFFAKEAQCPNCKTIFGLKPEHVGESIVVITKPADKLPVIEPPIVGVP